MPLLQRMGSSNVSSFPFPSPLSFLAAVNVILSRWLQLWLKGKCVFVHWETGMHFDPKEGSRHLSLLCCAVSILGPVVTMAESCSTLTYYKWVSASSRFIFKSNCQGQPFRFTALVLLPRTRFLKPPSGSITLQSSSHALKIYTRLVQWLTTRVPNFPRTLSSSNSTDC